MQISDLPKSVGKTVELKGWVYRHRASSKVAFIVLRDSTGIVQCTAKSDNKFFKDVADISIESSVILKGKVKKDKRAPTGYELQLTSFKIVHKAERYPITKDQSTEFLRDVRHLWIRTRKATAILKIRSKVFEAIHDYCHSQDFFEVQPPMLTVSACEGGGDQIAVDYFGKTVYLSQSWQLYAEAFVQSIEKVYCVTPAFRSEKSKSSRHLIEYWTAEMEAAWTHLDGITKYAEGMIEHICQKVAKECKPELKILERDPKDLLRIKKPFPRITYTNAIKLLEKDKMKFKWGKDLRTLEERQIATHFDKPVIITHYPTDIMAFYKPPDPKDPKTSLSFDIICPEIGVEIAGGSERSTDIEYMKKRLKKQGEDLSSYDWYLDTRRYGAVPHSGFGLGIERMIYWICKLDHIQDAIPFPRTLDRYKP